MKRKLKNNYLESLKPFIEKFLNNVEVLENNIKLRERELEKAQAELNIEGNKLDAEYKSLVKKLDADKKKTFAERDAYQELQKSADEEHTKYIALVTEVEKAKQEVKNLEDAAQSELKRNKRLCVEEQQKIDKYEAKTAMLMEDEKALANRKEEVKKKEEKLRKKEKELIMYDEKLIAKEQQLNDLNINVRADKKRLDIERKKLYLKDEE